MSIVVPVIGAQEKYQLLDPLHDFFCFILSFLGDRYHDQIFIRKKGAISHPMGLVFGSHIISLWWHLAGLTSSDDSWVLEICNSCSVPEAFFPDKLRCLKKGAS